MLKVGRIRYLNSLPLFAAFDLSIIKPEADIFAAPPSTLNQMLKQQEFDLSMISSVEFLRNQEDYLLFPHFGIAARSSVQSVNLYVKKGISSLDKKIIGVDLESASSVQLLKTLCEHYWKVTPHYFSLDKTKPLPSYDAFLLIGDYALCNPTLEGYETRDLATSWHLASGCGFLFGLFAVHRKSFAKKNEAILNFFQRLKQALNWSKSNSSTLHALGEKQSQLNKPIVKRYLNNLLYEIEPLELEGLKKLAAHLQIPYHPETVEI